MLSKTEQREKFMTFKERLALHRHLSDVLQKPDEKGYVSYVKGWDDDRVAKHFNVRIGTVRRFRQAEFGEMKPGGASGGRLSNLFADVNRRLSAIEAKLGINPEQDK